MAGAWDRRQPPDDRQPNRQLDFEADVFEGVEDAGNKLLAFFGGLGEAAEVLARRIIDTLVGVATDPIGELEEWLAEIPLLSSIVAALTGNTGGLGSLTSWATNLLTGGSALNADNLFGKLGAGLFSQTPIGSLTPDQPELVVAGNFPNLAAISDNAKFVFDPSVSFDGGTGSAKAVANGTAKTLRTAPMPVSPGQPIVFAARARWAGLVATGAPIALGIRKFNSADVELGVETLVELTGISGTSVPWVELTKDYTVPNGVAKVQLRLMIRASATAGLIWFDAGSAKQTGSLQLSWMPEAVSKFLGIFGVFGSGANLGQMSEAWSNILGLLRIGEPDDLLGVVDDEGIWGRITEFAINPLGWFANLTSGGLLPDSQKPAWLQNLTDGLGNMFTGSANTGLAVPNALESVQNIWGTGKVAQASADNANIGLQIVKARLDAPGVVGFDEFDYPSAAALPGADYALSSSGPGAGDYGPNGTGRLVWKPQGFGAREKIYKQTSLPLSTDNGVVTGVWSKRVVDPLISKGKGYLTGRCLDANNNTRIQAAIDNNTAQIQAVVAGVVTNIGSSAAIVAEDGDVWEFWYGTLTNAYKFWLVQNGTAINFGPQRYVEDTGHISQLGANNRMCGLGGRADNYAVFFQIAPPMWNGWTWRDQNTAA